MNQSTGQKRSSIRFRRVVALAMTFALFLTTALPAVSILPASVALAAGGTVTVNVYQDFNADGVKGSAFGQTDVGLQGITATAYCADGTVGATGVTDATGVATLAHSCADPAPPLDPLHSHMRIEVTWDPTLAPFAGLQPSALATVGVQPNGSTVQFVGSGAQTVNVGLIRPTDYVGQDANLVATTHANGTAGNDLATHKSIVSVPWAGGLETPLDQKSNTGAVWGVAYSRLRSVVFTSAMVKRHAGLGPGGIDAIYSTPIGTGASTVIVNVGNVGSIPNDATRELGLSTSPSHDTEVFQKVGMAGIGDLDISDDESELWYTNLDNGHLYRLPIGAPPTVSAGTPVDVGMGSATCTNGDLRPWATRYYGGKVYVGAVCDASGSSWAAGSPNSDLVAHVFVYDPVADTWASALDPILLDFARGRVNDNHNDTRYWYPWTTDIVTIRTVGSGRWYYPQPVLSDIDFDVNGVLLLGFIDRHGHQSAPSNYYPTPGNNSTPEIQAAGDQWRACWNFTTNQFVLESNGACGVAGQANQVTSGGGVGNGQGPGNGEFFYDENYGSHEETGMGGLAVLAGSNTIAATAMDPGSFNSGGIKWYNNTNGSSPLQQIVYQSGSAGGISGTFGKAHGMGDLELIGLSAPIEIGNRVWVDADNDGIQDPGEAGIENVTVTLWADTDDDGTADTQVGTATTGADGSYVFGGLTDANMTGGNSVETNTAYEVRINTTQTAISTPGYSLTTANAAQPANPDVSGNPTSATDNNAMTDVADSDATTSGNDAVIAYTTGGAGSNNHGLDFGFTNPVSLGSYVWADGNDNGLQDGGELGLAGATVRLLDSSGNPANDSNGNPVAAQTTGADGLYYFDKLAPGDYIVEVEPPAGYVPSATQATGAINNSTSTNIVENDSNIDNSPSTGVYRSGVVTLTAGSQPTETGVEAGDDQDDATNTNGNMTVDFGFAEIIPAAIGNYVWVDEDSNGLQDEGEPGIPNVTVQLKDGTGLVIATTVTDSQGGYLFTDLPPGDYFVDVDENTLPTGMTQTTDYTNVVDGSDADTVNDDGDFGNKDHSGNGYAITLDPGEENLTADFGYNYNPTDDVNNPSGSPTAALGDRIWIDTDGDGVQDPNEIGVEGVELTLYSSGTDGIFGTADDEPVENPNNPGNDYIVTTDENGNYIFDGLTPDAYVVTVTDSSSASHGILGTGYAQTGDPDHFGTSGTNNDNTTTTPVVLGPGDVFLNADFGYQPEAGTIGDTVWYDVDGFGGATQDPGEPGLAGVTVTLYGDTDGDGNVDDVVATQVTDANGNYLFTGLPLDDGGGDATYRVEVDITTLPAGLSPTSTWDGTDSGTDSTSTTTLTSGSPIDLAQDFSYTNTALNSVGDTVFGDVNGSEGDGIPDSGDVPLSGVTVTLTPPAGVDVGNGAGQSISTVTDASGNYLFSDLPDGNYTVTVDTATLPAGWSTTSTYESDGANTGSTSTVDLDSAGSSGTGVHDRAQDFSYPQDGAAPTGVIGDTIFFDVDGTETDGVPDSGDVPLGGVIVTLTPPAGVDLGNGLGQPISTVTDENGNYLFAGLPLDDGSGGDPQYTVTVDTSTLPSYVLPSPSYDPNGPSDSISTVILSDTTLGTSNINLAQDFSYPPDITPTVLGSIGDTIFLDADADGNGPSLSAIDDSTAVTQGAGGTADATDYGIAGVTVSLIKDSNGNGIWDTGDTIIATDTTDENGQYLFEGLPIADGAGSDDYLVWVNDTDNLLDGLNPTYDKDGSAATGDSGAPIGDSPASVLGLSAVTNLGTTGADPYGSDDVRDQDFGYSPSSLPTGTIGDTIWHDIDSSGGDQTTQGGEPGIAGVTVTLYGDTDGDGNVDEVVATTTTDANGDYLFTDLPLDDGTGVAGAQYRVEVDTADIAAAGFNITPTYDADGGADSQSDVTLTAATPADLDQDFSYDNNEADLNSIGDYVWFDIDGQGDQDATEPGLEGVTVNLSTGGTSTVLVTEDFTDYGSAADPYWTNAWTEGNDDGSPSGGDIQIVGGEVEFAPDSSTVTLDRSIDLSSATGSVDVSFTLRAPTDDFESGTDTFRVLVSYDGGSTFSEVLYSNTDLDTISATGTDVIATLAGTPTANTVIRFESYSTDPGNEIIYLDDLAIDFTESTETLVDTTTTDENGYYLFDGLADGEYTVRVDTTTLPGYVSTTATGDPDNASTGGDPTGETGDDNDSESTENLGDGTPTALAADGGEHDRVRDFGYPPNDTATVGAIGNTIWFDVNSSTGDESTKGDEPGLAGVTVTLTPPTGVDLGAGDGQPISTVTDDNGHYLFENLPLDDGTNGNAAYSVAVDTSTLPSYVSTTSTHDGSDGGSGSTSMVTLDDNDLTNGSHMSFAEDFSYPPATALGTIGDTVWFDGDGSTGNQSTQGDEPGIEGVVMELLDDGGNVIATTTTDENGHYYFGDLPLGETYQVRVAASNLLQDTDPGQSGDQNGVLYGMDNTYDPDDPAGNDSLGPQITLDSTTPVDLDQDFSYVGDQTNATTHGSIGNMVWEDLNADGLKDASEPGIEGVTIDLYRDLNGNGKVDPGEPLMGTETTAANGSYLFDNLPLGHYVVDVTDEDGVLAGYWHSTASNQDIYTDDNGAADIAEDTIDRSKTDTVAVSIGVDSLLDVDTTAEPANNLNVDFGYYVDPAAVGNYVWMDTNSDGKQDVGEPGINGVVVTLEILYPDGTMTVLKTTTGDDPSTPTVEAGWYSFANLLLDEDYNGDGAGSEPVHTIKVLQGDNVLVLDYDSGSPFTTTNATGDGINDQNDSDAPGGVTATATQGIVGTQQKGVPTDEASPGASYDFGVKPGGTVPVTISFIHSQRSGGEVAFSWQTATETGNAGFNILVERDGGLVALNSELIQSKVIDSVEITDYAVTLATDSDSFYIQEVGTDGSVDQLGPFQVGQSYGVRTGTGDPDPPVVNQPAGGERIFLPHFINQ